MKTCSALANGTLFDGNFKDFFTMVGLFPRLNDYWLPYTDEQEEGTYKSIYKNSIMPSSLFYSGQPDGGINQNLLAWNTIQNGTQVGHL